MTLDRFQPQTQLEQARNLQTMSDDERKRFAYNAAHQRDVEGLLELLDGYLLLYRAELSPGTLRKYHAAVKKLVSAWQHENLLRPSKDAGRLYVRTLEQDYAASTVGVHVSACHHLYGALRWAGAFELQEGSTNTHPFEHIKLKKDSRDTSDKRQAYSDDAITRLLEVADLPEQVAILLAAHAGLRAFEIAGLKWSDVGTVLTIRGKGGTVAQVAMSDTLRAKLELLKQTPDDKRRRYKRKGHVLPYAEANLRLKMRDICALAGVDYKALHSLRHSAATRYLKQTGNLSKTAKHLRHKSIQTTTAYAKVGLDEIEKDVKEW